MTASASAEKPTTFWRVEPARNGALATALVQRAAAKASVAWSGGQSRGRRALAASSVPGEPAARRQARRAGLAGSLRVGAARACGRGVLADYEFAPSAVGLTAAWPRLKRSTS